MKVGLALGSNLGDRLLNLQRARDYLRGISLANWLEQAPVYESEPVDCPPDSPRFLNTVVAIDFTGAPRALLQKTQAYENTRGRDRTLPVNSAREIDIDILYCGELAEREPDLVIPHSRLAARRFVLLPLATIAPDLVVPGSGKNVRQLLRELSADDGTVTLVRQDW